MGRNFHNLEVFKKAYEFVKECYPIAESWLADVDSSMADQLRRALVSIVLNIAEGCGRNSEKTFNQFLSYSYGSAREVEVLIMLARDFAYFDDDIADELLKELDVVKGMLYSLMKSIEINIKEGRNKWKYNFTKKF